MVIERMVIISRKIKDFTQDEENLIVKMYTVDNLSMSQINKKYETSHKNIKNILLKYGVEVDSRGKRKNNYIVDGNIAKIELKRWDKESLWTIIDLNDLERVLEFAYSWHSGYRAKTKTYYAKTSVQTGEKINGVWQNYTLYLHQFLLGYDGKQKVDIDHINHDTLDNRKENLRLSHRINNSKNRNGKNINNKSGYRNVACISNSKYPYYVQISIDGKNTCLGKFYDVDEAGAFAEEMRRKYYKDYAGENDRVV